MGCIELLRHRRQAGLTQRDLAQKAGVHHNTISALEVGKTKAVEAETLRRLSSALGVPVGDLFPELLSTTPAA